MSIASDGETSEVGRDAFAVVKGAAAGPSFAVFVVGWVTDMAEISPVVLGEEGVDGAAEALSPGGVDDGARASAGLAEG